MSQEEAKSQELNNVVARGVATEESELTADIEVTRGTSPKDDDNEGMRLSYVKRQLFKDNPEPENRTSLSQENELQKLTTETEIKEKSDAYNSQAEGISKEPEVGVEVPEVGVYIEKDDDEMNQILAFEKCPMDTGTPPIRNDDEDEGGMTLRSGKRIKTI